MYGENSGLLREALGDLLRQHRIQQRIGGAGIHSVPETTTVEERKEIGAQIRRYRLDVLIWCDQAMRAADQRMNLTGRSADPAKTRQARLPEVELRYRLQAAVAASESGLPTLAELTTVQDFPLVESWRQAARAGALGEHDFHAGVGYGRLSHDESRMVVHDAAEVTRALVGLDRRYANIPGWQKLKNPGWLGRAAEICAAVTAPSGPDGPDYAVDLRGWKPAPQLIDGPGLRGIAGVLQAQHNLLLHLATFPDAKSLRIVLDSQRILSWEAVKRLTPTDQVHATQWKRRAKAYGRLVKETRDLGGLVGKGGPAAGQGSVAAARMHELPADGLADRILTARLERVSAGVDSRVRDAIERGIIERLYFRRITVPGLNDDRGELVKVMRPRFVPITSSMQSELLTTARGELQTVSPPGRTPRRSAQNRMDFEAALFHCQRDHGSRLSL